MLNNLADIFTLHVLMLNWRIKFKWREELSFFLPKWYCLFYSFYSFIHKRNTSWSLSEVIVSKLIIWDYSIQRNGTETIFLKIIEIQVSGRKPIYFHDKCWINRWIFVIIFHYTTPNKLYHLNINTHQEDAYWVVVNEFLILNYSCEFRLIDWIPHNWTTIRNINGFCEDEWINYWSSVIDYSVINDGGK